MRKSLALAGLALVAAVALTLSGPGRAMARSLGTWEYPVLNGTSSQSLTWAGPVTLSGTQTQGAAGTSTLAAAGTAAAASTVLGFDNTPSIALGTSGQNTGVNVSTIVPVNGSFETIISSGGAIVLTSLPNISTTTVVGGSTLIPDGTWLVLTSTSTNSITLQSNGGLAGSQLFLGAATRVIALHKTIVLQFFQNPGGAAYWEERAYINDNN